MRLLTAAASFAFAAASLSCAGSAGAAAALGSYEGVGEGHGGIIRVSVTVGAGGIERIDVLESDETAMLGDAAVEELTEAVLQSGSTKVDLVSGATETSEGFIEAVEGALSAAWTFGGRRSSAAGK